jgi:hypothetical protein
MGAGLTALRDVRPDAYAALDTAYGEAVAANPPGLLELCGERVGMLLGRSASDVNDPKVAALADYASSPLFTDVERCALEFTEQYVIDVAGTPDDLVASLQRYLGPAGVYGFVMGLYAVDQRARLDLTAAVHPRAQS